MDAHGRDEDGTRNNHATWYDAQLVAFAGRKAGKTKGMFFREEYEALEPRGSGLFDADAEGGRP